MNQMNRRKIQKTGVATYTVSLPKAWVTRNNVKAGVEVSISEEEGQTLKISLGQKKEEIKEIKIDISEFNNETELIRKFISYYVNGFSKITMKHDTPISNEYMKRIIEEIKRLIGFEIIEETDKQIVMQDFFTSNYLSLTKAVRREFNLSKLIIQENKRILNKEVNTLDNVLLWEAEINRLYLLSRRQINFALQNSQILNQLEITIKKCQELLMLIGNIEKMADSFVEISVRSIRFQRRQKRVLEQINRVYDEFLGAYDQAFESVFKNDFALSNNAIAKYSEIKKMSISLEKLRINEKDAKSYYILFSKLKSTSNYIEDIAEIGLDKCDP